MPLFRNQEYKRLKRYPGLWRVDGIGQVINGQRLGTRVEVIFSSILREHLSNPYAPAASGTDYLKLRVHSAGLRVFSPGTIWDNGKLIYSPAKQDGPFLIDTREAIEAFPSQSLKLDGEWISNLIPEDQYAFGGLGNGRGQLGATKFTVVRVLSGPKAKWLIIPDSEILRLYFGPSSRMIASVLSGTTEDFIDRTQSELQGDTAVIHEKRAINKAEQLVFARELSNAQSKVSLFAVHQRLQKHQAHNQTARGKWPLNVEAKFPFLDQTTLHVSGVWVNLRKDSDRGKELWALLVMDILACARPFDFSYIRVVSDVEEKPKAKVVPLSGEGIPPTMLPDWEIHDPWIDDALPNRQTKRATILELTNRFPATRHVGFNREYRGHIVRTRLVEGGKAKNISIVDGGADSDEDRIGGGDAFDHLCSVDERLSIFLKMLSILQESLKKKGAELRTRKLGTSLAEGNYYISSFPWVTEKRRTWHLIEDDHDDPHARQVVFVEILHIPTGSFLYIAEMELSTKDSGQCTILFSQNDGRVIENHALNELLFLSAIQRRWIDKDNTWEKDSHGDRALEFFSAITIHRDRHLHPYSEEDTSKFAARWSDHLLEQILEVTSWN